MTCLGITLSRRSMTVEREATCPEEARTEPRQPWPGPSWSTPTRRKSCTLLKPALQLGQQFGACHTRLLSLYWHFSAKIVHPVPATAHKTAEIRFSPSSTKMQQARTHFIEQCIFRMILPSNHPHQATRHNHVPILAHHLTNQIRHGI